MLISNKYISLLLISGLMFSCQEDENLNLKDFPNNQPSFTIEGSGNSSNMNLEAIYQQDRTLQLNGETRRTYTFAIQPSPEDAVVTFTPICTNIPTDKVELSATKIVIPAGSTEASVTVGLKDDDFSFAATTLPEMTYELGVVANVTGYKIAEMAYEAKVVIKKEAFTIVTSFDGANDNSATFERTVEGDKILDSAPISYKFKIKFDKVSNHDVKCMLNYEGIPEAYLDDITVSPEEITIPAGQLESEEITWSMSDKFVLSTEDAGVFEFKVKPTFISEEKNLLVSENKGYISLRTSKSVLNIKHAVEGFDDSYKDLDRAGWEVTDFVDFQTGANGANILDDNKNTYVYYNYNDIPGSFIVDMKNEQILKGIEFQYKFYFQYWYATKNISISTSSDRNAWVNHGNVSGLPAKEFHYIQFVKPVTARYIKVSIKGYHIGGVQLSSIKMFE